MVLHAEVAVVGGGIVGLAHAWSAAKRGLRVVLFERDPRAVGASIRNFGMVWPIGQMPGSAHQRAMASHESWSELVARNVVWADRCGSLHVVYQPDEWAVIEEFVRRQPEHDIPVSLLSPDEIRVKFPAIQQTGLLGGMWSATEMCVDPRSVLARLPRFLQEQFGVELHYGCAVRDIHNGRLITSSGDTWTADRIIVCSGVDFQTLYPEAFRDSGIRRCKLQMMRTGRQPNGFRVGTMLAGGLTLCHYKAFEICATLPAVKQRIAEQMPDYVRDGIHVMLSQNECGEVVIGDSHEYDDAITPFDKRDIDDRVLAYLQQMVDLPSWQIEERWHGIYAKHPTKLIFTAEPEPRSHVVVAPGGAGMTLSFGFAEEHWNMWHEG